MTHGLMSILRENFCFLREDFCFICMDELEIGLFFLRLLIVSEGRLILSLKLLLFGDTNLFNQINTHV